MSWRPLVTDPDERDRIAAVIREIAAALDVTPPLPRDLASDRAIRYAYLAQDDLVDDRSDEALVAAVDELAREGADVGLFGGVAHVAWTFAHLADAESAAEVCTPLDAALSRALDGTWTGPYDLMGGPVGLGVHALERGDAGRALATRVIDQLVATARPRGDGLAWYTPLPLLSERQRPRAPDGYWNLGLAHGVAGVIALCARFVQAGVETKRARELLDGATRFLLGAHPARPHGRFPAWHAEGGTGDTPSSRLAWCYNDLGIAVALIAAAQVDDRLHGDALALARDCAARTVEEARIADAGLCHGAAGIAHLFNRLHQATGDAVLGDAARRWLDHTLARRTAEPIAGFPAWVDGWAADASLLEGATGVALVLHATISEVEPLWDRRLLADLAPA